MTELPITVLQRCRWTWRRIGVPSAASAELAAELEADLEAARADGRTPIDFVGGDPAGFARAWAAARDLVPQRLYLVRLALVTVLGAIPGCLAGLFFVFGLRTQKFAQLLREDPPYCVPGCVPDSELVSLPDWLLPLLVGAAVLMVWAGMLTAASAVLRFHGDRLRDRTVGSLVFTLPLAVGFGVLGSNTFGRLRGFPYGWDAVLVEAGLPLLAVALGVVLTRALVVRGAQSSPSMPNMVVRGSAEVG